MQLKQAISAVLLAAGGIAAAKASEDSIFQSKQSAIAQLRSKRGVDPDEWCGNSLKNPSCWEEFAETVWKPMQFNNLVGRSEGWPLYWCVKKCNVGDSAKDFVGVAHEEKREKKEEFCETMGDTDGCSKVEVGCPECCEKIPDKLICALEKVKVACPKVYRKKCKNAGTESSRNEDKSATTEEDDY